MISYLLEVPVGVEDILIEELFAQNICELFRFVRVGKPNDVCLKRYFRSLWVLEFSLVLFHSEVMSQFAFVNRMGLVEEIHEISTCQSQPRQHAEVVEVSKH